MECGCLLDVLVNGVVVVAYNLEEHLVEAALLIVRGGNALGVELSEDSLVLLGIELLEDGFTLAGYAVDHAVLTEESLEELKKISLPRNLMLLAFCAVLLFWGANLLVDNGIIIAGYLGVPERVIAVTAIALGTSLPELVTSIMSVVKGCENVGLGNIIGANILNLLLVIGIPATVTGIELEAQTVRVDAPLGALVMAVLIVPILFRKKASRIQGAALLAVYGLYYAFNFF